MKKHETPMLDQLEQGPWPSFISGIKKLRDEHHDGRVNGVANDLLGQLEHSYQTRRGYWKGGTVSVYGYGGGIIPRFSEVGQQFPASREFHTLRVQPPAGNYYTTDMLRKLADSWEKWGSGLVTFHGQTGNIMFIGADTENTQHFFDEINDYGFDLGGAGPCVRTAQSCVGSARCEQSCANEHKIHRSLVNNFVDDIHRPALPYKFKFKVSGCPNDWIDRVGWPRFFELTELPFTKFHIDRREHRGGRGGARCGPVDHRMPERAPAAGAGRRCAELRERGEVPRSVQHRPAAGGGGPGGVRRRRRHLDRRGLGHPPARAHQPHQSEGPARDGGARLRRPRRRGGGGAHRHDGALRRHRLHEVHRLSHLRRCLPQQLHRHGHGRVDGGGSGQDSPTELE